MIPYQPTPADRFTFGLWTFGNPGRDPFGDAVRPTPSIDTIERALPKLAELGAYGVNLHDNDLVPMDATAYYRDQLVGRFMAALAMTGLKVPMATTNLFTNPVFKDGAFTSNDRRVRAYALQKTMQAIDLGVELGATIYVFWGCREGTEVDVSKNPVEALEWFRECLDFLCHYVDDQGYDLRFALEAKPNEPRGDIFLPTTGSMLAFIQTLSIPNMVGVNPEVAHETMAGLNFTHAVAQALEAEKLFHIDLNSQKPGRYDQDFRFGQEDIKGAFFLVKLLEENGYAGMRHFDSHAMRTEDMDGVWAFCRGCMRTYKILQEKVRQFAVNPEIQGLLATIRVDDSELKDIMASTSPSCAEKLQNWRFDPRALAARGLGYEQLDQLVTELLLGVR